MLPQIRLFSYVLFATKEFVQGDPETRVCLPLCSVRRRDGRAANDTEKTRPVGMHLENKTDDNTKGKRAGGKPDLCLSVS